MNFPKSVDLEIHGKIYTDCDITYYDLKCKEDFTIGHFGYNFFIRSLAATKKNYKGITTKSGAISAIYALCKSRGIKVLKIHYQELPIALVER